LIIDNIEEGVFAEIELENIDVSESFKAFTLAPPTYVGLYMENKDDTEYYKDVRRCHNDLVEDSMSKKILRNVNNAFVSEFF
jgi:hypothetical protein